MSRFTISLVTKKRKKKKRNIFLKKSFEMQGKIKFILYETEGTSGTMSLLILRLLFFLRVLMILRSKIDVKYNRKIYIWNTILKDEVNISDIGGRIAKHNVFKIKLMLRLGVQKAWILKNWNKPKYYEMFFSHVSFVVLAYFFFSTIPADKLPNILDPLREVLSSTCFLWLVFAIFN